MRYKKHMIILLAAIFLFAMATASATDLNDTAVAVEDGQLTDEIIQASENQENTIQASYNDEVNLSEDDSAKLAISNDKTLGTGTDYPFIDIQNAINGGESTIYLKPGTYTGDNVISIGQKSNIKIIGNSTILDAQGQTEIFYIAYSSNITIQNIIFKNGYTGSDGGAIYVYDSCRDCSISNCTFINNTAGWNGGAIRWSTGCDNGRVSNCTFINNHAEWNGGAIDWYNSNGGRVNNCTFINNTADWNGYAIHTDDDLNADYNWFGNTADNYNDQLPITYEVKCDYRLFLKATANPDTITGKDTSNITFKLYQYHSGVISDYDNAPFKNLDLTITATNGNVKGTAKLGEPIQFTPTRGGTASVTATVENVRQTVEINVKGDFDLLQDLVNNESLSVINLERNYTYNEFDTITGGVIINRPITINGNGFTIDAKGKSRIFYVTAGSINITDVTLKNGKADEGGAIYFVNAISNSNINATYINNTAEQNGGANYFLSGVSGSSISGTYTNNIANGNQVFEGGGANYFQGRVSSSNITGTYINNKAEWRHGGANYFWDSVLGSNISGTYANNTAMSNGGANFFNNRVSGSNISGTYTNNTATQYWGGANYFSDNVLNSTITGTYINNKAERGHGGANCFSTVSGSSISGTYINNNANNDGGANYFWSSVSGSNVSGTYINNTVSNAVIYFEDHSNKGLDANITNAIFLNNNCTYEISARIPSDIRVKDSWFGNNASNYMNKPNINDKVTVDNWLFLNATADPSSLLIMDSSNVTFKLYSTDGTNVSDFDNSGLPAVNLTLTANNGDVDKTTTLDNIVKYVATEHGKGSVTAKIENASYTIYSDNILRDVDLSVSAQNITYLENEVLTLIYNNTATGKVNITLKSKNYKKTIEGDINRTITIADLPAGEYTAIIEYLGDNVFSNATSSAYFTVEKITTEIIPDKKTIDLFVEDKSNITYTLSPDYALGNVSFSSNDTNIVSVDSLSGDIMANAEGSAAITVSFSGSENYTASNATVIVNVKKIPTQITVNSSDMDMKVNGENDVGAGLEPANAGNLTYKSGDEDIVIVENGRIKGLKEGNATITVGFAGDKKYAAAENKTIAVNVRLNDASVSVNNATLDLFVDDTFDLIAGTVPEGLNVTYVPDNSGVVSVDNKGVVTALKEGTANITVKVGGDGVYAENSTTVTVTVSKIPAEIVVQNDTVDLMVGEEFDPVVSLMPSNAGNMSFKSSDVDVVLVNGHGFVLAIGEGNATVTVAFDGNEKYAAVSRNITVSVTKIPTEITLTNETLDLKVNDMVDGLANLTPGDAGNLTFISSDEEVVFVADGMILAYGKGTATVTVSFAGNDKYAAAENKTITVNVSLRDASVSVENATLDLKVDDRFDLNATTVPDWLNVEYASSDESVATVTDYGIVTAVGEGTATITMTVGDDAMFAVNSTNVTVTVSKQDSNVNVSMPENITVGENSTVNVVLPEDATGNVTVKVDGEVADTVAVTDGSADVTIPSMSAGNHTVEIAYSGDGKYNPASETKEITVSKKDTTPEITIPSDIEVGDNETVDVKLPGDAGGNVTLKVDGGTVDTVPVENGTASVKLPELNAGNHTVEIAYSGDDKYKSTSKTATITVNKYSTNITAADVTATYKVNKYLVINLADSRGNPLANATVTVELTTAKNYTSDENGQIKVKVSSLVPKTYTAKITFKGDEKYAGSETTAKVTVKKATAKITAKAKTFKTTTKTKKYTVTLKANGKALKNKWVYLKVNGKTYKAKTNSKGKATFKITQLNKAGKFKATVTFKGNDYYKKATKKVIIKVKSVWKTIQKGSKNSAIVKKIQRALKNHGYYLEYNGRYLKVDGIFWDYTEMAVKEFQNDKTLKVTGKVDEKTAKKLGII